MIVEQTLVLIAVVLLAALLHRATRINMPLACALCGFAIGQLISLVGFDTGIRASNLQDIVFYLILPLLVFEAAWEIDLRLLRRWLWPAMLLATLGTLISTFVTAGIAFEGIDHARGYPWLAALLTGAILAATDPASVIAQLREAQAPQDLSTLFESESLFNDASAVVLFTLVLTMALEPDAMHGNPLTEFAWVFLGGALLGLLTGLATALLLRLLGGGANATALLLFTAFGSFLIAEHALEISGIMAVLVAALIARAVLQRGDQQDAEALAPTWAWAADLLNSILFVIMGLVVTPGMFTSHWLAMLIAIAAALVARAAAVVACAGVAKATRVSIPWRWQLLLVWGGLRGVIALALVLALPLELDYWYTVQCMVFGVVLFSLVVQGSSNPMLVRRLGKELRN